MLGWVVVVVVVMLGCFVLFCFGFDGLACCGEARTHAYEGEEKEEEEEPTHLSMSYRCACSFDSQIYRLHQDGVHT